MTALEILRAARAKIERPEHWCQGLSARDYHGSSVDPKSASAFSWCALGAIWRFSVASGLSDASDEYLTARAVLERAIPSARLVSSFNDDPNTSHDAVLAMFDRAIASVS